MTRISATDVAKPVVETGQVSTTDELARLSHDVKNALHGVSINLEVARSRAARGIGDPAQIVPFLDNAAQQLDTATKLYKQVAELVASLTQP
jgi:hypothetical protein